LHALLAGPGGEGDAVVGGVDRGGVGLVTANRDARWRRRFAGVDGIVSL
jgi:hypothetical protein